MEWSRLLSRKRFWVDHADRDVDGGDTAFTDDAERILYSSAFRRLQGKTQVHPLPRYDYLRTRLTHSIEVAHTGRMIARQCLADLPDLAAAVNATHFEEVVYAACLAHDVGNPPFGHIGEYAIQTWFGTTSLKTVRTLVDTKLDDTARLRSTDFLYFDGNAQAFRILTRLSGLRQFGGLQLTFATLGAGMKYPFDSSAASEQKPKFGYMQDDVRAANLVATELGLDAERGPESRRVRVRHPLAFIVEAADDICYLTTDIEDSFRVKMIEFTEAETTLKDIAEVGNNISQYPRLRSANEQDRIAYLRSMAVRSLAAGAATAWQRQLGNMIEGTAGEDLISRSQFSEHAQKIRELCRTKIYKEPKKLQLEAAGYHMIISLMEMFGGMIDEMLSKGVGGLNMRNQGLHQLLPKEFRDQLNSADSYGSYLVLVDYISGMTDRFILDLFQRLTGSSVSLGRMA